MVDMVERLNPSIYFVCFVQTVAQISAKKLY